MNGSEMSERALSRVSTIARVGRYISWWWVMVLVVALKPCSRECHGKSTDPAVDTTTAEEKERRRDGLWMGRHWNVLRRSECNDSEL